jgi:hypothetical protein
VEETKLLDEAEGGEQADPDEILARKRQLRYRGTDIIDGLFVAGR